MKEYRLSQEDTDRIAVLRASCSACGGNPSRCMNGTGEPFFVRLTGCSAFDAQGAVKPERKRAAQPWELAA